MTQCVSKNTAPWASWAFIHLFLGLWTTEVLATPKIVVLPLSRSPDVPPQVVQKLDQAVLTELAERRGVSASRPEKLKGTDTLAVPTASDALRTAEQNLNDGSLDTTIKALDKYIEKLERALPGSAVGELSDAYLLLSKAHFQKANDDEGQRALEAAIRLRPDRELEGDYPPLFLRLYRTARENLQKRSLAELTIEADASNAELLLNGRLLGTGPVVVRHVPPGTHFVVARIDGRQAVRRIELGADEQRTHRFFLGVGQRRVLPSNRLDAREKGTLGEVARVEGADAVLAGILVSGDNDYSLHMVLVNQRGQGALVGRHTVDKDLLSANIEAGRLAEKVISMSSRGFRDEVLQQVVPGMIAETTASLEAFAPGKEHIVSFGGSTPSVNSTSAATSLAPQPSASDELPTKPSTKSGALPQPTSASATNVSAANSSATNSSAASKAPEPIYTSAIVAAPAAPIRPSPQYAPLPAEPVEASADVGPPIYKRWWFWTVIGVVVVGGAAAATTVALTAKVDRVSVIASW